MIKLHFFFDDRFIKFMLFIVYTKFVILSLSKKFVLEPQTIKHLTKAHKNYRNTSLAICITAGYSHFHLIFGKCLFFKSVSAYD